MFRHFALLRSSGEKYEIVRLVRPTYHIYAASYHFVTAEVCGRLLAGIADSNPAGGIAA